jgi:hypothetical protein
MDQDQTRPKGVSDSMKRIQNFFETVAFITNLAKWADLWTLNQIGKRKMYTVV